MRDDLDALPQKACPSLPLDPHQHMVAFSSARSPPMTRDFIDGEIMTDAAFDAALEQLLLEATRNDIDPRGSWVYRNGQPAPDWEVMVFDLGKPDGAE